MVSIVIPTFNESKYIEKCLQSINSQSYTNFEIILVDNGSTDATVKIAQQYVDKIVESPEGNIAELRNKGAAVAKGEILGFIDADCLAHPNWLNNMLMTMKGKTAVCGCYCTPPDEANWVEKAWYSIKPRGIRKVNFLGTANLFFLRSVFTQLGGFDTCLSTGEDYDICQRAKSMGYAVISNDKIKVIHLRGPKSLIKRFQKEIWYGHEMLRIFSKNHHYPIFYLSIMYLFAIIALFIGIVSFEISVIFLSAFVFLTLPIFMTIYKCYRAQNFDYMPQLIVIYCFYLSGRSVALITSFCKLVRAAYHS